MHQIRRIHQIRPIRQIRQIRQIRRMRTSHLMGFNRKTWLHRRIAKSIVD